MKKVLNAVTVLAMAAIICFGVAACGGEQQVPEGFTRIDFYYDTTTRGTQVYENLVNSYNAGQGQTDKVFVLGTPVAGITNSAQSHLMRRGGPNVITVGDRAFKSLAVQQGLMLSLEDYAAGSDVLDGMPDGLINRFRFDSATHAAGEGAPLIGVPNGNNPMMLFYNVAYFESAGINIISVAEADLADYNRQNSASFVPHGYAEYAAAPMQGLQSSVNLAGETVYKVFNEQIPMNWEEQRYLCKCFTSSYNGTSPSTYGFASEWWFTFGWSVGGDCIGYDGEKYVFTIGDKTANYLVTADGVTVNGNTYNKGEIVSYEDKINDFSVSSKQGLYALPSQYDAFLEFNRYTAAPSVNVDGGNSGYAIGNPNLNNRDSSFMSGNVAMLVGDYSRGNDISKSALRSWDAAPEAQWREYEGGSVYYSDGNTFANEFLKVVGKTYDDGVYTGALKTVGDLHAKGGGTVCSQAEALVIPARSDSTKYDAAWNFITYASSREGQVILAEGNLCVPNQTDTATGSEFTGRTGKLVDNLAAAGVIASNCKIGDWAYFEEGSWVTAWANVLNGAVRGGSMTITTFLDQTKAAADSELAKKDIRIRW